MHLNLLAAKGLVERPFNSLFEMQEYVKKMLELTPSGVLSILYLRCGARGDDRRGGVCKAAFNSLFEMLQATCRHRHQRLIFLSILYLRCDSVPKAPILAVIVLYTFNSLFEMRNT